jgi:pimeloyl-ACP methyl ester carboxylesterase
MLGALCGSDYDDACCCTNFQREVRSLHEGVRKRRIEAEMKRKFSAYLVLVWGAFCGLALFGAALIADHATADEVAKYPNHQDLSFYLKEDGTRVEIRNAKDWQARRRHIVSGMEEAMGRLPRPAKPVPLDVEVISETRDGDLIRKKLAYHTDRGDQRVHAWLLMPADAAARAEKRPAVLCLHQTTPNGKDSPMGLADRATLHYGIELAKRGYVTLAPDYPSLGEHKHDFDADEYESGSMKAIYDNMRTIDLLQSLPEVDGEQIGCIGHSLGGHNGLFTAVFDERIKAVVTSCGFTSFAKYMGGDLHGWAGPRYMPRVASKYQFDPDRMPFDFAEVIAAIAPRGVFIVAPLHDDNFDVAGVRDVVKSAESVYKLLGHADRLQVVYPEAPHDFPNAERQQSYEFLDKALGHEAR